MEYVGEIKRLAKENLEKMQTIRRTIHQNPELGNEEFETQKLVEATLDELGIEHHRLAGTGVVGLIKGAKPGKTVLLRADMDALPIQEEVDVPFKSQVPNVMHACGHDGHTANLLGVAMILNELKDHITGNIKLMFQPAEESTGGADRMIKEGILSNPDVSAVFGLHLGGDLEEGVVEIVYGPSSASPDEFLITVVGKGGHAAVPQDTIDPVNIVAQFVNTVPAIVTRLTNPMRPIVLSITNLQAGGVGLNVIPQEAKVGGSLRTMHKDVREKAMNMIEKTIQALCDLYGATYTIEYLPYFPSIYNDKEMTDIVVAATTAIVGEEKMDLKAERGMGAEDFAFLTEERPGCYYHIGIKKAGQPAAVHHHPSFAWDDALLETTAATLANVAVEYLEQNK